MRVGNKMLGRRLMKVGEEDCMAAGFSPAKKV